MPDDVTFIMDEMSVTICHDQSLAIIGFAYLPGPTLTLSFGQVFEMAKHVANELAEEKRDGK